MRIAVVDRASSTWSAGGSFTEMVVRSLRGAGGKDLDIVVLGPDSGRLQGLARSAPLPAANKAGGGRLKKMLGKGAPELTPQESYCESEGIDALFLATRFSSAQLRVKRVAWIFDFQHRHLTKLFSREVAKTRDEAFEHLARYGDSVMLSSRASLEDFKSFLPDYAKKGVVTSFPSLYTFLPPPEKLSIDASKYGLSEKFVLVANQYWEHKNHSVVTRAVSLLKERGIEVPVVFTGMPLDSRDPGNASVSRLLQDIASSGVAGHVVPLGFVPREDLTDLMRLAAVVIQPSRFEGWSTVVQDAKALGRPLICSDIDVLREQAPGALGFFGCDSPEALAGLLEKCWQGLSPGPDFDAERAALKEQEEFAAEHGKILLELCGA